MKIRITGTCPDKCWYNDKQGQVFTVVEPPKWSCGDEYAYWVDHHENREGQAHFVWKDDCEVVNQVYVIEIMGA